jgi:Sensors of blue-light using FAD
MTELAPTSAPPTCPEPLCQLAYCSIAVNPIVQSTVDDILRSAQRNNLAHEITGVLLADDRLFVQWIEGPMHAVRTTWKAIVADPRHHCIVKLLQIDNARERAYPSWSMGYRDVTRQDVLAVIEEAKSLSTAAGFTPWKNAIDIFHTVLSLEFAPATPAAELPKVSGA